jgi:hypothetical protein
LNDFAVFCAPLADNTGPGLCSTRTNDYAGLSTGVAGRFLKRENIMGAFSRSWRITKLSFSVIGQDKEMLLFPLIASIASLAYMVALILPSGVLGLLEGGAEADPEAALGILQ